MKMFKTVSLMALGAGAYMMYDKYGKQLVNKMSKKMNKAVKEASDMIDDML